MRVIGRYFAIGGTLGSVSGLVGLVLIWTWLTLHLGVFGFLVGWIPAGVVAAALWLALVVFWGPILVIGGLVSLGLLLVFGHGRHDRSWDDAPIVSTHDQAPATAERWTNDRDSDDRGAPDQRREGRDGSYRNGGDHDRDDDETDHRKARDQDTSRPGAEDASPRQEFQARAQPAEPFAAAPVIAPPMKRASSTVTGAPAFHPPSSDDLGGDAAAAGDTSRRQPH